MSRTISVWLYRAALAVSPPSFRRRFAASMLEDFCALLGETRGARARLGFALREVVDVTRSAWRDSVRGPGGWYAPVGPGRRERLRAAFDDFLFAARALRARPGYAAVSILTLALGIAATTTVLSVIDKVVVQPLPYPESGRLVHVMAADLTRAGTSRFPTTPADFLDWREQAASFEALEAQRSRSVVLTGGTHPERISVGEVTDGTFALLGVSPHIGALLTETSDPTDIVLTHGAWQRMFAGDPDIVGRALELDGESHVVAGVMPEGFRHPWSSRAALFRPLRFDPVEAADRSSRSVSTTARLAPGVTFEQAREEMRAITARIADEHSETHATWGANVLTLKDLYLEDSRTQYILLGGAVALVLLIACVNLASLVLARGAARHIELAIRQALGAGRGRLVRLLVAEGTLIAAAATLLGLLLAVWGLAAILPLAPTWPLVLRETTIGARSVVIAVAAAIVSLGIYGLLPALGVARLDLGRALGGASRSGGGARSLRFRRSLVVAQLAVAIVLMIGAGLLVRSVVNIVSADNGFDYRGVVSARVLLGTPDTEADVYFDQLLERTRRFPEVTDAALVDAAPMDGSGDWVRVYVDGERQQAERALGADYRRVSPNYFDLLSIDMRAGRLLNEADGAGGEPVAVINEDFARRFLGDREPLGATIALAPSMGMESTDVLREWRVVGIVETVQEWGPTSFQIPIVYVHHAADPTASMSLLLATAAPAESMLSPLRAAVAALGDSPVDRVQALSAYFEDTYTTQRFLLALLSAFAALAAALAAIGLYGVMAYHVLQRQREIGVRVALGAGRQQVAGMILRQGAVLALVAAALGTASAVPVARAMSTLSMGRLLVDMHWLDPLTFGLVPVIALLTALVATWIPARRAARLDPVDSLRSEA